MGRWMPPEHYRDVGRWVAHVFDHPGERPEWYWDLDADLSEPEPAACVDLLTQLFSDSARTLARYSDAQVGRGLWYLVNNACSCYSLALIEREVDLAARLACIEAIPKLFAELFRARCAPELSHGSTGSSNPLNTTCYMWWDLFPGWGTPRQDFDDSALAAMSAILEIDSLACQESALHGLGHWQSAYPQRIGEVIDRFLKTGPRPELRAYASAARQGCVQ